VRVSGYVKFKLISVVLQGSPTGPTLFALFINDLIKFMSLQLKDLLRKVIVKL
jgi:hypothetical protein